MSIPLTIDWLTLAWLRLQLSLWWKARRRLRLSPRELILALLCGMASGCVPVTRFEEAQSAAQVEMDGRHRAEYRVAQLQAENAALLATSRHESRSLTQQLESRDDALAQAELDKATQGKERADAEGLVEQLRGELARVGGHLQSYRETQQKLESELRVEGERGRQLARLTRDIALLMAEPITVGTYSLDCETRHVVLRVPRSAVLAADRSVKPDGLVLLQHISKLLALHPETKVRVEDLAAPGDPVAAAGVVGALGLSAERVESVTLEEPRTQPAPSQELALGFSVP